MAPPPSRRSRSTPPAGSMPLVDDELPAEKAISGAGPAAPSPRSLRPAHDGNGQRSARARARTRAKARDGDGDEAATGELRALQAITDTALSHLAQDDLVAALLARLLAIMGVDHAAVLLLEADGQHLAVRAACGLAEGLVEQVQVPLGQGFAGRIAATRAPLVVDDLSTFPAVGPLLRQTLRSVAGVPLLVEERLIGVVWVGSASPRRFTAADITLLAQVADRMALAIDRAHLYMAEQQTREQLGERVAQLEAIMEAVPEVLTVYDEAGRVVLANAAHRAQFGRFFPQTSPGESVHQRVEHVGGVYDAQGVQLEEAEWPQSRALRGEMLTGAKAVELSVRTPQDEMAIVIVTGAPLRDADGRIVGAVTASRDITEQKRLERERAEQAEELARVFEGIADGLMVYNAQGQLVQFNGAAQRILALDALPPNYFDQPMAERATVHFAPRDEQDRPLAPEEWPLMRVLRGEVTGSETRDIRAYALDGQELALSISAAPLRDREGRLVGAVNIVHDETEREQLKREREAARAHEVALQEVTRRMDEFLAIAAHDLRTPLTVVKNRVQIALRRFGRLRERAADQLDFELDAELEAIHTSLLTANQSADRLIRLQALLFDVAQAQSGTLELHLVPCDLVALVREQVGVQRTVTPDRNFELDLPDTPLVVVLADADRLGQVLGNYLSNAVKYAPDDQPVEVKLEVAGRAARVAVRDAGPGLPEAEQRRVGAISPRAGRRAEEWHVE